tara:strand:- start:8014 stop:8796 length:783 start_codon:yes stop_codon:yes gene_type:complete
MSKSSDILTKVPNIRHREESMVQGGDDKIFDRIIRSRRSVRVYKDEAMPKEVLNRALDWALLAPTSSNLQCWEFHHVASEDKRQLLVKACLGQSAARTASALVVAVARTKSWPKINKLMLSEFDKQGDKVPKIARTYYEKIVPLFYGQGFLGIKGLLKRVMFFCRGLFSPTPRGPKSHADMRVWSVKTTALACENFMLGMTAQGYDTCPMEGFDEVRVQKLLKLPSDAEVVMVIGCGKRAENGVYGPQVRFDKKLFLHQH